MLPFDEDLAAVPTFCPPNRRAIVKRPDQDSLRREISTHEAELEKLDAERAEVENRLRQLRDRVVSHEPPGTEVGKPELRRTPGSKREKVALFRSMFSGRTDVYPKLWRNTKKNKQGYAPACANEWAPRVCDKPKVKCGECPNQAFLDVTDKVLLDHLQGRHVLGVYPLLGDETCRFLAVDFDKGMWQEDVAAYVAMGRRFGLTPAVERSRSGNGAHVWFFFSAPIPASDARKMASYLLTETMAGRPGLPLRSYDRLFPNQDTMPRGGFGNLIALPLQYEARQRGNTVFVDAKWEPFPEQWEYLAALPRIDPKRVEELAREASAKGKVLGVPGPNASAEDGKAPWLRRPSRQGAESRIVGPFLPEVKIVLSQQLFVEKAGLPPALVDRINRLAAFQNPQFYEKQAMRLSTALTPRIISCAEDLPGHIGLPRGCLTSLEELLNDHGIEPHVEDQRIEGDPQSLQFHGELTDLQKRASRALMAWDMGVFVAPPGSGKTVVGAHLIASRGRSTLVIVHRTQLLDQWRTQLGVFLDLKQEDIGQIGGGKRRVTGVVDVAMIQSLVRRGHVEDLVATYGHVIVDECHHVPAVSFERVMREVRARYVTGLTATPKRRDGHHPILEFQLGRIRYSVDAKKLATHDPFQRRLVVRETGFRLEASGEALGIQEIYGRLAADDARNRMIVDDIVRALEDGRSPILLTERRSHLEYLVEQLQPVTRNLVILRGGMGRKQRRAAADMLAAVPESEERLILATGRFAGEGFDDARLDTLFLAMPFAWKGTLVQYAGRLHRRHHGKTDVCIVDYVDRHVPVLGRMFEKRQKGYRAMGYELAAVSNLTEVSHEHVIEYDEEALRLFDANAL